MKLIKSIVRPNKVDEVKAALEKLQISGMTVTEVRGHGKQKGHTAIYRGQEYNVSLLPKMEIEVVVADSMADDAIKAIIEAARTGEIGDGRVFVLPVTESYKIRTGERESSKRPRRVRSGECGRGQVLDDEDLLARPDQAELAAGELLDRARGRSCSRRTSFRERRRFRPAAARSALTSSSCSCRASPHRQPAPDRRRARRRR